MPNTHGGVQNRQNCALHNETIRLKGRRYAPRAWRAQLWCSAIQKDHDIRAVDHIEHGAAALVQQVTIDLFARKLADTALPGGFFRSHSPDFRADSIGLRLGLALGEQAAIPGLGRVDEIGARAPGQGVEGHEHDEPATTRMNDHGAGLSRISVKEGLVGTQAVDAPPLHADRAVHI